MLDILRTLPLSLYALTPLLLFLCTCARAPQTDVTDVQPDAIYPDSYRVAPFDSLDVLATNDWWTRDASRITNLKIGRDSIVAFGAYTVANGVLKLSAQLYPLYPAESRTVYLDFERDGEWQEYGKQEVNEIGWHALFRVEDWPENEDTSYRLRHENGAAFEGTIRHVPPAGEEVTVAALSCNSSNDTGGREEYVRNINALNPDLVFFAGDQSYFHKEHTAAWLLFGKQFREVFRHRPMVSIPDDHDIGQGNLWGEGGKRAERVEGDDGGYYYDPDYVKMVERAQTSHLPDPYDPTPVAQGIGVYYTDYPLGSVDFAIIEDRKFKSGPKDKIPQQGPRPDHIRNPDYDPATVDVAGLELLGERQLSFLEQWGGDPDSYRGAENRMKAVLSQTGFANGAHIHGQLDNRLHADMDSNGWPQTGRNKALRLIRDAGAVHIGGDQHLATVIHHGIEEFNDGPYAFLVPAIVNNYYSRWWWPASEQAGPNAREGVDLPWLGEYRDGFDNPITMLAYANPDQPDHGAGFGFIRFDPVGRTVTFECWPRTVDVTAAGAEQFEGWPYVVRDL
ncbi:hypothetical protein [Neolewinella sp.]|uniref:hypothetical protein n=1 Tax=Neolewinella sp. TaxID=2993543 RepID=UPI003B51AD4C